MEVSEKRDLLIAIDTLIKRPGDFNEQMLIHALTGFKDLIEESLEGKITVTYEYKD